MGRNTRGGRNWEGFGPDPYLAGVAMNSTVIGLTVSNGTIIDALSSNVDDRTLHELYIWPFVSVDYELPCPPLSRMTSGIVC